MLAEFDVIAFVHTADAARARQFYVGVLGLELIEESPFALVLRSGRSMIRVTPVESHAASPHTVLGWSVGDLSPVIDGLTNRGVQPLRYDGLDQDERGIWQAPGGARVAWFPDPDGNVLSLTQL
jgi:catechol 2,3-dioxygenase-like lactoylglutathione lyase family enzyme